METGNRKFHNFIWSLVLCICIVSGAAAPAYADTTTTSYNYYGITLGDGNTGITNLNSADMLGYVLSVLSSNQKAIYNKLSNLSGGGSIDYTTILNSINTNTNNIMYSLDGRGSGLYTLISGVTNTKLDIIAESIGVGSSLDNLQTKLSGIAAGINRVESKLHYWDNSHARGYDLAEMVFSVMNSSNTTSENTTYANEILTSQMAISMQINTDLNDFKSANHTDITQVDTDLNAFKSANHSDITQVDTDLNAFKSANHTDVTKVDTDLNAFKSANHSDITSFKDDYNNINWVNGGTYLGAKSDLNDNYISVQTNEKDAYFLFQLEPGFYIYDLKLPVRSSSAGNMASNYSLNAYLIRNTSPLKIENFDYDINVAGNGTHVYVYLTVDNGNSRTIAFQLNSNNDTEYSINPSITPYAMGVTYDTKDFYDVGSWLDDRNILKLFKQAKEVYFDDKTIAAKKANQDNEDSFLNGFTGLGSASASPSDFGAVKDSIVDFKAGFSGGASSSDTFSFMSGDSNAWDWFTQETANDLDRTQGNNNRLLRGSSDVAYDTPLLDSYYTSILSILGGEN